MTRLLVKKGRIIDPSSKLDAVKDLLIENGKIIKIADKITSSGAETIDAANAWVLPGLVDMHCHLRDPGNPEEETIASGTRSAALGGYTSIACMANTEPPLDNRAQIQYAISKAQKEGLINVFPIGAVSKGLKGEELAEIGFMLEEGAKGFSDDGKPIMNAELMRMALQYLSQFDLPVISHCEDSMLSSGGEMNEGALSTELGLKGIPKLAEEIMVERDLRLAEKFGRVHIAHVSTSGSVDLVRQAKKRGVKVTAETAPHYFSLTEEAVRGYNTNAKVNPPLRTAKDVKAIIKGLGDGTIDAIATDHAPHVIEEKNVEFGLASNGMVGFETALALVITFLVNTKALTPLQAVPKLTIMPANILKINKGTLKVGSDADVTIVDPKKEWTVDASKFSSRSKNSPFDGMKLQGKVMHTIVGGRIVVKDSQLVK
ncbi:MAG: dihydroorotase [Candidatus Saganbacteria bacterium]|nr:dihydroorotase [Candidatus Saganbacteria bacterium]